MTFQTLWGLPASSQEKVIEAQAPRICQEECEEQIFAAVTEDRRRIAADLHDNLGGTLSGLSLQLSALRKATADLTLRTRISELERDVSRGLAEIRTLAFALQVPDTDAQTSFETAVARFATGFGRRAGLEIALDLARTPCALDTYQAHAMMRVLQEALLNVHRHASARTVQISFSGDTGAAILTVLDDGRGMIVGEGAPPTGVGLTGMRHRVEGSGGALRIESGPTGTKVTASIPLRQRAHVGGARPRRQGSVNRGGRS